MTDEMEHYDDDHDTPAWGQIADDEQTLMRRQHLANPDDAPGYATPDEHASHLRGPDYTGSPGFVAIVQGQVYLVAAILFAQLFLITLGLFELLSGRTGALWWIAGASLIAFLLALLITLWPRRRVLGSSAASRG
jgi:hypothetical protein